MGNLRKLSQNLQKAYSDQEKELKRIIKDNSKVLVDLNTRQLIFGIRSDNQKLPKYKSKWYDKFKRTLNPRGVTDLRVSGKFHQSFFVTKAEFPIIIDAKDRKRDSLVKKYGLKIFGLTPESKKIFAAGYVKKNLLEFYRKMVHLR
jgi:hypothetical protein